MSSASSIHEAGYSKLVLWNNPEGWDGMGWDGLGWAGLGWAGLGWGGRWAGVQDEGTHVHPWLIHVDVWQKPAQY